MCPAVMPEKLPHTKANYDLVPKKTAYDIIVDRIERFWPSSSIPGICDTTDHLLPGLAELLPLLRDQLSAGLRRIP
jgi:hypothetical protein